MRSMECAEQAGISYRRFDYWCRKGYIPGVENWGTGHNRDIEDAKCAYVVRLAKLVKAGLDVRVAAQILKSIGSGVSSFHITPDVSVTIH